jgi:hypothetical protein
MQYKKWVKKFLSLVLFVITLFALFNYTIDPLWTYCHSNRFNKAQPGFDERQLKTNRAYFCGLGQYDALLLGSSRVTYINQHDFKTMQLFNYAGVSMYPSEYSGWIEQAKKIKGTSFKTILLGVDFFGSNDGAFGKQQMQSTPVASHYLEMTHSFMYRYKMLFTMDTLNKSLESIAHSKHLGTVDYTRDNVKQTIHISDSRKQQAVNHQTGLYGNMVYGNGYHYNTKVRANMEQLKKENPTTDFILFTTPISADLFKLLVQRGNLPDYKRWLTMLVDVFGEVYDFMGINTITNNPSNYADLHHFYPEFGTLIADRVTGVKNSKLPDDFGIRINKENLEAHLKQIDKQVASLNL